MSIEGRIHAFPQTWSSQHLIDLSPDYFRGSWRGRCAWQDLQALRMAKRALPPARIFAHHLLSYLPNKDIFKIGTRTLPIQLQRPR
jgi:hypothetical protein